MQTTISTSEIPSDDPAQLAKIEKAIAGRSFAMLSTVSESGFPHAAGVVYDDADGHLYVHTMRSSRKARSIVANGKVAVVIPVRRMPVGPPFTVQFQGSAALLEMDDAEIVQLLEAGKLPKTSGHGALEEPDGCFLRITPQRRFHSYGIGVSAIAVARDPLHNGARTVELA